MKVRVLVLFLLVGAAAVLRAAAGPLTVAVGNFGAIAEAHNGQLGGKVTALIPVALATDTNLTLVERSELNKALSEQVFGLSGMVSADAAARIGQITGARVLVSGHLILINRDHLVIIADIIGTETGRLFAAKVEGPVDKLVDLTTALAAKISQIIAAQSAALCGDERESKMERIDRIVKSIHGTNRPAVALGFHHEKGPKDVSYTANTEMGIILQKAGFPIVDEQSDRKPDIVISGLVTVDGPGGKRELHTEHAVIEMEVQDRRNGAIIAIDRQENDAVDATMVGAQRAAQALAVDKLAERLLPLLAK